MKITNIFRWIYEWNLSRQKLAECKMSKHTQAETIHSQQLQQYYIHCYHSMVGCDQLLEHWNQHLGSLYSIGKYQVSKFYSGGVSIWWYQYSGLLSHNFYRRSRAEYLIVLEYSAYCLTQLRSQEVNLRIYNPPTEITW